MAISEHCRLIYCHLRGKLVTYPFYSFDIIVAKFFPKLTDVNIYGSVANHNIVTPNRLVNLIAGKYLLGLTVEQGKQLKLFLGNESSLPFT